MRVAILLSMQRALLELVTPDLRGVAVYWTDRVVRVRFIYERPVDDELFENASLAETSLAADLPPGVMTDLVTEHVPPGGPLLLSDGELWVYLRKED